MATIKSFTSLEQSKKLAEILPLESADMYYISGDECDICFGSGVYEEIADWLDNGTSRPADIPCWSLAALLGVLPKTFNYNNHTYQFMYNAHAMFYINIDNYDEDTFCSTNENLVDVCVDMIIRLHELNLL